MATGPLFGKPYRSSSVGHIEQCDPLVMVGHYATLA
jgi:hypothetical protein